ncbi:hypothetical protein Hamer_G005362, partial [Homarus americanus]
LQETNENAYRKDKRICHNGCARKFDVSPAEKEACRFGCKIMLKINPHEPPNKEEDMVGIKEIEQLVGNKTFQSYREKKQPVGVKEKSFENVSFALGGKVESKAASTSKVTPELSAHHTVTGAETERQKNITVDILGKLGNKTKGSETVTTHGKRGKKTLAKKEKKGKEKISLDLKTLLKRNGSAFERITEPKAMKLPSKFISTGEVKPTGAVEKSISKVRVGPKMKPQIIKKKIPSKVKEMRPVKKVKLGKGKKWGK